MTFAELRILIEPVFRNVTDPIALLQKGYVDCVKKIRLLQHAFVGKIDSACGLDGFNHIHILSSGDLTSEIAFKEVYSVLDVSFSGRNENRAYSVNPMIVAEWTNDEFETDLEFVSDEGFMWIGSDLVPLDREIAKVEFTAYPFPYFCRTADGPFVDKHRYNIQWMIDEYGEDGLIIDDFIGVLAAMKTKSLMLLQNTSINEASNLEYFYDQLLNAYNDNTENFFVHGFENMSEQISRFQ